MAGVHGKRKREVGKRYYFTYEDVEFTDDGTWADPRWFKPLAFDLVQIKAWVPRFKKVCEYRGWWNGNSWEGARMSKSDSVIAWKLCPDSKVGVDAEGKPLTKKTERKLKNLPKTEKIFDES